MSEPEKEKTKKGVQPTKPPEPVLGPPSKPEDIIAAELSLAKLLEKKEKENKNPPPYPHEEEQGV